jgi:hypothetical protein
MSPQITSQSYDDETPGRLWGRLRTVAISTTAASGDATIHATASGVYFLCFALWLTSSAGIDLTVKSGSTAITGGIPITSGGVVSWSGYGYPIMRGRATGEALVLNASASTDLRGFALVAEKA